MKILNKLLFLFVLLFASAATASAQSNDVAAQGKPVCLIMGDSVMKTVSVMLEKDLAQSTAFRPVSFVSLGSGLCRLDLLDWHAKIKALVETEKPAAAVMLIGVNDDQPMQTEKGILQHGSDEWLTEYARRMGKCMDIMIQGGIKNIIWVALPDMRKPQLQEHVMTINRLLSKEAASRPAMVVMETQKTFGRVPGKFTMHIVGPDGMLLTVRSSDGSHFNREGANLLVGMIIRKLNELQKKQ